MPGLSVDCPDLSALALLLLAWLPPPGPARQALAAGRGGGRGVEDGGGGGGENSESDGDDGPLLSDEGAFSLYAATLPTAKALSNGVTMSQRARQAWAQVQPKGEDEDR